VLDEGQLVVQDDPPVALTSTERTDREESPVQGVVKAYDPATGLGSLVCDTDLAEYDLAAGALHGSVFRMLRQGQRVVFDVDPGGLATSLRLGSEVDMGTPGFTSEGVPIIAPG